MTPGDILRVVADPAQRFLRWWAGELAALVPGALRRLILPPADELVVSMSPVPRIEHHRGAEIRGAFDLQESGVRAASDALPDGLRRRLPRHAAIVLRLAASQVLHKRLELPAAAEPDLRRLLAFEIDRQTPFRRDQVVYDARVASSDAARGTIHVDWVIASRAIVDEACATVRSWGLEVVRVDAHGVGVGWRFDLLPPEHASHPARRPARSLALGLGASAAGLAVALAWMQIERRESALAELRRELESARHDAATVQKQRIDLERIAGEYRFVAEAKGRSPSMTRLLEDLSALLPDDTWLLELQSARNEVRIAGFAPGAAALLASIEGAGSFRQARFRQPVVPAPQGGERFSIAFDIESGGAK